MNRLFVNYFMANYVENKKDKLIKRRKKKERNNKNLGQAGMEKRHRKVTYQRSE